jgi:hypothetical protein
MSIEEKIIKSKINHERLIKAEKHQAMADMLNGLNNKCNEYNWTKEDLMRNIKISAENNQRFADEELKQI